MLSNVATACFVITLFVLLALVITLAVPCDILALSRLMHYWPTFFGFDDCGGKSNPWGELHMVHPTSASRVVSAFPIPGGVVNWFVLAFVPPLPRTSLSVMGTRTGVTTSLLVIRCCPWRCSNRARRPRSKSNIIKNRRWTMA